MIESLLLEGGPLVAYFLFFVLMFANGFVLVPSSQAILLAAGIVVGYLDLSDFLSLFLLIAGNVLGTFLLYEYSRKRGLGAVEKLLDKLRIGNWRFLSKKTLDDYVVICSYLFDLHGGKAILLGRNLPILHSIVSIPAGIGEFPKGKFLLYTTLGITAWTALFFFLGRAAEGDLAGDIKFWISLTSVIIIFGLSWIICKYKRELLRKAQKHMTEKSENA